MARTRFPDEVAPWIDELAKLLHATCNWRLCQMLGGMLFATGRRTVASWLRAGGLRLYYQDYYYFLGVVGRNVKEVAGALLLLALRTIHPGERVLFAIDDTPTKRYGPEVEGAGMHHNPTPGPAGQKFLYGHVWVTLSWVVRHTLWGTIGLPILALLYVRRIDVPKIHSARPKFQTKLEQAAALVEWLADWLKFVGKTLWLVVDGAYAKRPFLRRAKKAGAVVVSRLRKDAALYTVPTPVPAGQRRRGRPRIYGKARISLAKRAGHRRGWLSATLDLYHKQVVTTYKTFQATYKPAGGLIRVVLVREDDGSWRAYFCTDANATVAEVLQAVADRSAIEQNFHDVKEVHGAGQQQLRNYWANIGGFNLILWLHTLIELWAWSKPKTQLVNRRTSPWDDPDRRPSHADRRNAMRRQCLAADYQAATADEPANAKITRLWQRLLGMVA